MWSSSWFGFGIIMLAESDWISKSRSIHMNWVLLMLSDFNVTHWFYCWVERCSRLRLLLLIHFRFRSSKSIQLLVILCRSVLSVFQIPKGDKTAICMKFILFIDKQTPPMNLNTCNEYLNIQHIFTLKWIEQKLVFLGIIFLKFLFY